MLFEGFDGLGSGALAVVDDHVDHVGIDSFLVFFFLVGVGLLDRLGGLLGLLELSGFGVGEVLVEILHLGFAEDHIRVLVSGGNHNFGVINIK